jgi:nitrogen regulatory protein P-II 2
MKLVTAIIKPFRLYEMQDALQRAGVRGLIITEARGCSRQRVNTEVHRGAEYAGNLLLKIEIAVATEHVDEVTEAIIGAARTGEIGDGKFFVSSVEQVVRIRTGETGETAL